MTFRNFQNDISPQTVGLLHSLTVKCDSNPWLCRLCSTRCDLFWYTGRFVRKYIDPNKYTEYINEMYANNECSVDEKLINCPRN